MSEIAFDTLKSVKNYQNTPYLGQNPKFSENPNFPGHPPLLHPWPEPHNFIVFKIFERDWKTLEKFNDNSFSKFN